MHFFVKNGNTTFYDFYYFINQTNFCFGFLKVVIIT